ncbi:hypothetical protein H0H81_009655 [Sphagnurus paluster]|uniref:G domain-containing protein n=1 Tax=Sphagnurus paluster TaxID=117069 RepID=A0A9P7KI15_9AGAR|nr:hypothetical protein H0H81_009655 [Sphagnurus paluster]
MGPTGVGKSTFINTLARETVTDVGHTLESQTAQLKPVVVRHPSELGRRIILVDTPGFDDTYVSDSEILRRIADWLARSSVNSLKYHPSKLNIFSSYSAHMKLAGVIYLHEITQTRMLGTARKNLDLFHDLCGKDAAKNVILVTTKWSEVPQAIGERRELQLREVHWKFMLDLGSQLCRFTLDFDSGWHIVHKILQNSNSSDVDSLQIQTEIVDLEKIVPETAAGLNLRFTLEELLEAQRKAANQLMLDPGSSEMKDMIEENRQRIANTLGQLKSMNIPLDRRLRTWIKNPWAFINRAAGVTLTKVGHTLDPETKSISCYLVSHPCDFKMRFFFIDTPGFDDAKIGDKEIILLLAKWLQNSDKKLRVRMKLIVLYLVEIDQPRKPKNTGMTPSKLKKIDIDQGVIIATTKWGCLAKVETGFRRENEICNAYSKQTHRFEDSSDSAWRILGLCRNPPVMKLSGFAAKLRLVDFNDPPKPRPGFFKRLLSLF